MRRIVWLFVFIVWASLGCDPAETAIDVTGTLYECSNPDECDEAADAPMRVTDLDEVVQAEVVTDSSGEFLFEQIPGESVIFVTAEKWPEFVPTVFLGQTGSVDGDVPDGSLYLATLTEAQAIIDEFTAVHPDGETVQTVDPDSDGDGGMARGQFVVQVEGLDPDQWPGKDSIRCYFEDTDGEQYPCTYYDSNGEPDWSLETTTLDGGFVAFGLPVGLLTMVVVDGPEDDWEYYTLTYCFVEEDGLSVYDTFISPF